VGKFSKIKKYSKPSLSVDEKIDKLNKELKKTGMLSEIANSTSGVYTITQYTEPVPAVPPTLSDVPDISGITGNGFTQNDNTGDNTGYNDTSQLFNNNLGGNPTPIIQTPAETPAGGVGVVWHDVTLNGTAVGYIGPGNVFHQVLNPSIAGGTELNPDDPGYYGGNYYTERPLRSAYSAAYQSVYNVPGTYITWQCWLPYNPYGFGALYSEYTGIKKQDGNGAVFGLANVIVGIRPNKYTSNPGSPAQPGYTVVLTQNRLGDPNYFPGPVQPLGDVAGLGPLEVQTMLNIIRGTPGTPDAQRARDTLNRWAKPGSKNRDNLIKMGVLEQASAGGNMGDIAQVTPSATGSGRMPYGTPGGETMPGAIRGYRDSGGKVIDFDNPATWPSIKNQVKGA